MKPNPTETVFVERAKLTIPSIDVIASTQGRPPLGYRLGLAPVTIGSDASADLVVTDPTVSRRHCTVALTDRGILVRDLNSKNGTFYERARVSEIHLGTDAALTLSAQTVLTFRASGAPVEVPLAVDVTFGQAFGSSEPMRALFAFLMRVAPTHETVLLFGESGTGKEILARAIHDRSPRANGPFIPFDCGAVSPALIESELFGHVRGAFTGAVADRIGAFAQAHGGTLFLDEIGELPLDQQPKLLRALETREFRPVGGSGYQKFDARIVAATHRDLPREISEGRFREDLYYRLAVVHAFVPPLRERGADIELLAERFLAELRPPRRLSDLSPSALAMLKKHDFPGNVRELKNLLLRLVLFPELVNEAFERVTDRSHSGGRADFLSDVFDLPWSEAREHVLAEFERKFVTAHVEHAQGNVSRAAATLGVSRQFLHRVLARHGIRGKQGPDE